MKFTKKTNYLELVPSRVVQNTTEEEGKITLLVPKFKNELLRKWLIPKRKSDHFRIHLDALGSQVWRLIDGKSKVNDICSSLQQYSLENNLTADKLEIKIIKFLSELYKSRFIEFTT